MGTLVVLVTCFVMFLASFLAGIAPLSMTLTENTTKLMSAYGGGLLVGTTLIVVIPEGIEAIYAAHNSTSSNDQQSHDQKNKDNHEEDLGHSIGIWITLGFLSMFILDSFSNSHNHSHNNLLSKQPLTILLGLSIHCFADGIAMGAAFSSNSKTLEFLVSAAILLHKAPAACALSSFLLSTAKYSRETVKRSLIIFSLATPIAVIMTYILIASASMNVEKITGTTLLFSGGSFLYVSACHILPELRHGRDQNAHDDNLTPYTPLADNNNAYKISFIIGKLYMIYLLFQHLVW